MRAIVRTSRNTGVSVGPVGMLFLGMGYLFLGVLIAAAFVLTCLAFAAKWGYDAVRERRRRPKPTAPHLTPGTETWARGHRQVTATERAIMTKRR